MALIPFAVLWLAYQFGWYGVTEIMGYCGIGFMDLIMPGKTAHVDEILNAGKGANCGDQNSSGGSGGINPGILNPQFGPGTFA